MNTKKCTKCGLHKSYNNFYTQKESKDGFRSWCKDCMNINNSFWRKNNGDKVSEITKRAYKKNKELYLERSEKWRKENPEHIKSIRKNWKEQNREHVSEYGRKRYVEKKGHIMDVLRKWISNNREKKRFYQKNRSYQKKNGGHVSINEWKEVLSKYGDKCLCCGATKNITIDHVIPLAVGGKNTKENLQPLCLSCNASKGKKIIDYRRSAS